MNRVSKIAWARYQSLNACQRAFVASEVFSQPSFSGHYASYSHHGEQNAAYQYLIKQLTNRLVLPTVNGTRHAINKNQAHDPLRSVSRWVPGTAFAASRLNSYAPLGDVIHCSASIADALKRSWEKKMLTAWQAVRHYLGSDSMNPSGDYGEARLNYAPGFSHSQDVYFVLDHQTNKVKIGISKQVTSRMESIKRDYNTGELSLLAWVEGGGRELEQRLHRRFTHLNVHHDGKGREWFDYNDELQTFISDLNANSGLMLV